MPGSAGFIPLSDLIQLPAHSNMTVEECLKHAARSHDHFQDCIIVGYDQEGQLVIQSSKISRQEAAFLLLLALDHAKKIGE